MRLVPLTGYPKQVFPQEKGETKTFGLEGGIGRKGKLGTRGFASEQGRSRRERKAERDTHRDTDRNKERKEKCQGGWGQNDGKLGKSICKIKEKLEDVRKNMH